MIEHPTAEWIHAYLDGEMEPWERRRLDEHLDGCERCAASLRSMAGVADAVRALPPHAAPPRDLWSGIEARLEKSSRGRRIGIGPRRLHAAGIVLALASAGGAWLAVGAARHSGPAASPPVQESAADTAAGGAFGSAVHAPPPAYQRGVMELERALEEGRHLLDPGTVVILERSLGAIDQALAEAEEALVRDPGSEVLRRIVAGHEQQRMRVLQLVTSSLGET